MLRFVRCQTEEAETRRFYEWGQELDIQKRTKQISPHKKSRLLPSNWHKPSYFSVFQPRQPVVALASLQNLRKVCTWCFSNWIFMYERKFQWPPYTHTHTNRKQTSLPPLDLQRLLAQEATLPFLIGAGVQRLNRREDLEWLIVGLE